MKDASWVERRVRRKVDRKGLRPSIAAWMIAIAWIGAIIVFGILEHLIDPETFDNVWLGMWWATETVTTVGYGDTVPEQTSGRLVAAVLMIGGLSLFSVITGIITSAFVTRAQADRSSDASDPPESKLDQVLAELEDVRGQLSRLQTDEDSPPPGDQGP
ncbi:MAG: two pore domain potassium channel family protein [Thermoleophilia bacterium]|nr:two pore domain potassium channel family protein [Thermoleophilia bacterium]